MRVPLCGNEYGGGLSGRGDRVDPDQAQEYGVVRDGHGDRDVFTVGCDGDGAGDTGGGQVVLRGGRSGGRVDDLVAAFDGLGGVDGLSGGAGGFAGEVVGAFQRANLAAPVDGQPDHRQHGQGQYDDQQGDATLIVAPQGVQQAAPGHDRVLNVSSTDTKLALSVFDPGRPSATRSLKSTTQV